MEIQYKILSFVDLYEAAGLLDPANSYEKQDELVAYCRSAGKPFLTKMLVRHRFECEVCGILMGEAYLCFEDPSQPLREDIPPDGPDTPPGYICPDTPSGYICPINLSVLHGILAHGKAMPEELEMILSRVRT